ncbi:hypothetical protein DYI37_12410 [Fulvimarina endophytica]|uniref:DUF1468 domain-containing protein n=1 Tax=Fulvimarina endophytica TaxID=2293836 RepID=A0A371X0N2_9HYPH|nr:tripartite tricarboxylate transporter TctB family protein [Fulvimarina endophytica]RFC62769.1 hypothetical protein DYI37_12410 [Fulvimarina endophytica]
MIGQICVALAAIALAGFFWTEASTYPETAAQLPQLLAVVVALLAIAAIVQASVARLRLRGDVAAAEPSPEWRDLAVAAGFLGLIVLYGWSITRIGYLVATPLFLLIPLIVLRPVGLVATLATIVSVTAVIFGVFVWFLNLSIPLYPAF